MKTSNVEPHGLHATAATRGQRSALVAGSKGMTWRDAATETVGQIRDMTVVGATLTDNEDGTGILIIGGSGGATVLPAVNVPISAALSNPPTQAELETAIGLSASAVPGQAYIVTDSDSGRVYGVYSDGSSFVFVPLVGTASDLVTLASGAGIFSDFTPRVGGAASYDATSGKTFFTYLNENGDACVSDGTTETVLHAALSAADSHGQPSLLVRSSDRKVIVAYSPHNSANLYVRISSSAADISAFAAEVNIDSSVGGSSYTYPVLIELTDGIYLFVRTAKSGTSATWSYSKSTDNGATWAAKVDVFDEPGETGYWLPSKANSVLGASADDRIDFLASPASAFAGGDVSMQHCYMLAGGTFYKSDGTEITATKPFATSAMTEVWSGTGGADQGQVVLGPDGQPRIVFLVFEDISPEDCHYWWGAYLDGAWTVTEFAEAGSGSLTATAVFPHGDPYTAYYSKDVVGVAQIHKAVTADEGLSWTHYQLTDSANENALLATVRNGSADLKVIWNAKSGGWTRNDTVAADFIGASFVPAENVDAQRIVVIDGSGLTEAILQRTAGGAWQISRDMGSTWESIGGAGGIDDLSDVTITAAAVDDTLRWNGSTWVNDNRRWEPVTINPGTGPELVWDGDEILMNWAPY